MMIDYYRGRTTDGQEIALLAPLAEKLRPDVSANANFVMLNRLSEELNSRDAFIGLSADDDALLAHIAEAKKYFVDFSAKEAYDRELVAAYQEEKTRVQEPSLEHQNQEMPTNFLTQTDTISDSGKKKLCIGRFLVILGTALASGLIFIFHLNVILLLIIVLVAFILFLLYADEEKS